MRTRFFLMLLLAAAALTTTLLLDNVISEDDIHANGTVGKTNSLLDTGTAIIRGQVIDEQTNKPAAFAKAIIYKDDELVARSYTDEEGFFIFEKIGFGCYSIQVESLGYETSRIDDVCVKKSGTQTVNVRLYLISPTLKPILYLYPESKTEVAVNLVYEGVLTHTYPKYKNGWNVTANPDGTLVDAEGKEYYALYWEGQPAKEISISEGFVVPGKETAVFLEDALARLGLNRREANEFIVYWLPLMEDNPYNLIHFSTSEYEKMARLEIIPKPETLIRVMMIFQPLDQSISIKPQELSHTIRKGFTVVEWGGHEIPKENL